MKRTQPENSTIISFPYPKSLIQPDISEDQNTTKLKEKIVTFDFLLQAHICTKCQKEITNAPVLLCANCPENPTFCQKCFFYQSTPEMFHKNTHEYYILDRMNYPIYSPDWTAFEEIKFVKCIFILINSAKRH